MSDEKWLNERKKGIGGSDAAAICGVSPYRTPLQVWQDKRGLSGPLPDNEAMLWGRILEPAIRQRYSDITGRSVRMFPKDQILHHPQYPFMLANLDGFTDDQRVVEIKTAKFPTGWGEPGTDEIPLVYMFQVQHYLTVTAFSVADLAVLIGGNDFRLYEVPADRELQEMLIEKEVAFWKLVQENTPPAPINYEDVIRRFRVSQAKTITATEGIVAAVESALQVKNQIASLKEQEEMFKGMIMEDMKEADTLIDVDGSVLVTWKTGKPVNRVDLKALQKEQPEIYSKYLKPGEGNRRFLIKGEKS